MRPSKVSVAGSGTVASGEIVRSAVLLLNVNVCALVLVKSNPVGKN